ncbi:MAG TPA: DUF4118 domain-containing protein, partial [Dehalococcoidia bacterium]|nr:DUF4118 domain-containing protein [Dehalococcoidia bacterium]
MNSPVIISKLLLGESRRLRGRLVPGAWRRWLWQGAFSTATAATAVAVMRPFRSDLGLFNVALILLLLSVIAAAAWGWAVGLYTSVLCNLLFNYFFVPPLYTFSVQRPENALALALFLVVAAITASLLARSRQHAIAAEEQARTMEELLSANRRSAAELERRARETQTLLALSRTARDTPLDEIPAAICALAVRDFSLLACTLYRFEGDELLPVAHAGAGEPALSRAERSVAVQAAQSGLAAGLGYGRTRVMRLPGQGRAESGRLFLPLGVEGGIAGVLRLRTAGGPLSRAQEALLEGFADEAASALHRASLAASARAAAVLQETDRLRSALLSSVSHDLRTPLTAIKAAAEGLRQDAELRADVAHRDLAASIDHEVARLDRLVGNLLEISRIESGGLPLRRSPEDLRELMGSVSGRLAAQIARHRLSVAIAEDLPLLPLDAAQ